MLHLLRRFHATAQSFPTLRWIVLGAMILTAAAAFYGVKRNLKNVEQPIGCDDFGYMRQAQLINARGLASGLDTRIDDATTGALIRAFRDRDFPAEDWQELVAPHCHHYKSSVERVILQYPPGTGSLMAPFPAGRQARLMLVCVAAVLLAGFLIVLVRTRSAAGAVLVAGLAGLCFNAFDAFGWSMSIGPSLLCAVVLGYLLATKLDFLRLDHEWRWHAVAGLVLGLSVVVRIPNAFMIAGFAACYAIAWFRRPSLWALTAPAAFALAMIVGMSPVFWVNAINAGSALSTTYSTVDAARPLLNWQHFREGVRYFLVDEPATARIILLSAAAMVIVAVLNWRQRDRQVSAVLIAATVNLTSNLGYFILHYPRAPYYPVPVAIFAVSASVFAWHAVAQRKASDAVPANALAWRRGAALICFLIVAVVVGRSKMPLSALFSEPDAHRRFDEEAVIWADLTTGYFQYFQGRQASKLAAGSVAAQDRAIEIVSGLGRSQIVVADSPSMMPLVARLNAQGRLLPIGLTYGHDTFMIRKSP